MTTDNIATTPTAIELTFLLREAPAKSAFAGQLCAELRATSRSVKILRILSGLGLWHPTDDCAVNVLEKWSSGQKDYKILRFTSTPEVYRQLHELCSEGENVPGHADFATVTNRHLAAMSIPTAIETLIADHHKKKLISMATAVNPDFHQRIGKNPNKRKLAEFICAYAV